MNHLSAGADIGWNVVQAHDDVSLLTEGSGSVVCSHDESPGVSETVGEDASTSEDGLDEVLLLIGAVGSIIDKLETTGEEEVDEGSQNSDNIVDEMHYMA